MKHLISLAFVMVACQPAPRPPAEVPSESPSEVQERLDTRVAVPLLGGMVVRQNEVMRDRLKAVQEIVTALSEQDFETVTEAAARIAYSSGQAEMCHHMAGPTPGFGEQAVEFHKAADGITTAAKNKDTAGVLSALGASLSKCNGCHETFKSVAVSEARRGEMFAAHAN